MQQHQMILTLILSVMKTSVLSVRLASACLNVNSTKFTKMANPATTARRNARKDVSDLQIAVTASTSYVPGVLSTRAYVSGALKTPHLTVRRDIASATVVISSTEKKANV